MNCQDYHEQLALRMYGELDARATDGLELHLSDCAACRAFAGELEAGLGRLVGDVEDDLPEGWARELRGRVAAEPAATAPRSFAWVGIAAGFLLGLVSMSVWQGRAPRPDEVVESPNLAAAQDETQGGFRRSSPPPLAANVSDLGRLQTYLRR